MTFSRTLILAILVIVLIPAFLFAQENSPSATLMQDDPGATEGAPVPSATPPDTEAVEGAPVPSATPPDTEAVEGTPVANNEGASISVHDDFFILVRQAYPNIPSIQAWIEVHDTNHNPVPNLATGHFVATLGNEPADITGLKSLSTMTNETTAFILLFDKSLSMKGKPFKMASEAAKIIIEKMRENDQMAIGSFGTGFDWNQDFTSNKEDLLAALSGIDPKDQKTHMLDAINSTLVKLKTITKSTFPKRKIIIVISDGDDDGSTNSAETVLENLNEIKVPIFAAIYKKGSKPKLDIITMLTTKFWGTLLIENDPQNLTNSFYEFVKKINVGYLIDIKCRGCSVDDDQGATKELKVMFNHSGARCSDIINTVMISSTVPGESVVNLKWYKNKIAIIIIVAGLMIVLLAAILIFRPGKAEENLQGEADEFGELPELPFNPDIGIGEGGENQFPGPPLAMDGDGAVASAPGASPMQFMQNKITEIKSPGPFKNLSLLRIDGTGVLDSSGPISIYKAGVVIGRNGDIRLTGDDQVSSKHCKFQLEDQEITISDLGSTNGTMRNGIMVRGQERIEHGDEVTLGKTLFRIDLEGKKS